MFQYVWFDRKSYRKKELIPNIPEPGGYDDIEAVRLSFWAEHCLECAAPQCYRDCPNWLERYDQKCKRFYYGIHHDRRFKAFPYGAELRFRKWGKLETYLFPGTVRAAAAGRLDRLNRIASVIILQVSRLFKPFSPGCRPSRALETVQRRILERFRRRQGQDTGTFLFEAYSHAPEPFRLGVEIVADNALLFREGIPVSPGYNRAMLELPGELDLPGVIARSGEALVRVFPENDYEAELTVLFLDFVKRKDAPDGGGPAEKVKCVAWDLDNTVWDGTLIESDPAGLRLREHVLEAMRMLDARGIIQTAVSKNYEAEAEAVLKRLEIDHFFVGKAINWESKSGNIAHLAKLLNINVNTFALIDDSPFERNEVASRFSCVRVYDENILPRLKSLDEFDVPVTGESVKRREMYQTEAFRNSLEKEHGGNNLQFLRDCGIRCRIAKPEGEQVLLRCYELLHRTNQLNLSGKKYDKDAFYRFAEQNADRCFVMYCGDKFGDYGQIAYFVTESRDGALYVTEFAMSCRVAGKYVESALIKWLQEKYARAGLESIVFEGVNSGKNKLLIDSLQNIGMENTGGGQELVLKISAATAPRNWDIVEISGTDA